MSVHQREHCVTRVRCVVAWHKHRHTSKYPLTNLQGNKGTQAMLQDLPVGAGAAGMGSSRLRKHDENVAAAKGIPKAREVSRRLLERALAHGDAFQLHHEEGYTSERWKYVVSLTRSRRCFGATTKQQSC
ncbi:hypothetical protein QOT17_014927 [Balamuthia mandrillaris]